MIAWIDKSLALAIHDRQLAEFGGSEGVRDATLLESALARPQQLYAYGEPAPNLAASLVFGLARNHPFVDGNERTAHVCYRTFLALNDLAMNASAEDMYVSILALATSKLPEKDFAAWLRRHISAAHGQQIQEPRPAPYRARPTRQRARKR